MTFQHSLSLNIQDRPLVRGYVHSSYADSTVSAVDCFRSSLTSLSRQGYIESPHNPASWFVGIFWQDQQHNGRTIDFFQFSNYSGWPGNPEVSSYVVRNGLCVPGASISCTEGLLLLGMEEQLRRGTKSLDEYCKTPLDLASVNRKITPI